MIGIILVLFLIIVCCVWCVNRWGLNQTNEKIYTINNNEKFMMPIVSLNNNYKKIRIITNINSCGIKYDAEIYNKLLKGSYIFSFFNYKNIPKSELERDDIDINIFIEKIWWNPSLLKAKQNWLLVNQEYLNEPLKYLKQIDLFLCKSLYALSLVNTDIIQKYNLNRGKSMYIGHTSISPTFIFDGVMNGNKLIRDNKLMNNKLMNDNKDEYVFMHTAGQSPFKNTKLLIKVWEKIHKKYPMYKLWVTCKSYCSWNVDKNLLQSKNGIVYNTFIDSKTFEKLQEKCICYVCPSLVEGYGHYINEGRASGCAIITTNAPPMNELVVDGKNGLLIPVKKSIPSSDITHFYSKYIDIYNIKCVNSEAYLISFNDLYNTIEKFILLPFHKKIEMCNESRNMYLQDNYNFQKRLNFLIS